jgi:hypothetical protein
MPPRIVISLTTTPTRIHAIEQVLRSLLAQSRPAAEILLNVPFRLARSGEEYLIPDWVVGLPGIRIHRCQDYGPATKLLGALERETDPDTLIITVDDDVLYPPGMVATYWRMAGAVGACVACTAAFNIADPFAFSVAVRGSLVPVRGQLATADVAEGYGSCFYRRHFFDKRVFEVAELPDFLFFSDDIAISNYLGERGIGIRTIAMDGFGGPGLWRSRTMQYGFLADALHRDQTIGTNRERYAKAVDYLLRNRRYFLGGVRGFPSLMEFDDRKQVPV